MKNVPATKVVTTLPAAESPLPAQIQEAPGELVGAAREGLLALSVGVGLGVVHELVLPLVDRSGTTGEGCGVLRGPDQARLLAGRVRRAGALARAHRGTRLTLCEAHDAAHLRMNA